jgi:hypothetical protein
MKFLRRKHDDWALGVGTFWRGVYKQNLNATQTVGLLILILFYVAVLLALVVQNWPSGPASFWQKAFRGYGPYLLLSMPLGMFFLFLHWRMHRTK